MVSAGPPPNRVAGGDGPVATTPAARRTFWTPPSTSLRIMGWPGRRIGRSLPGPHVPLGSITYHFASLTDLQAQAFARHVELQSAVFENLFEDVKTHEQFVDVLVDLVHGGPARHRSAVLGFELHLAALRNPGLRALTQAWTEDSRTVLARFTGPDSAARLDPLLEGMIMHALLTTAPESRERTRDAIDQTLGPAGRPGSWPERLPPSRRRRQRGR